MHLLPPDSFLDTAFVSISGICSGTSPSMEVAKRGNDDVREHAFRATSRREGARDTALPRGLGGTGQSSTSATGISF